MGFRFFNIFKRKKEEPVILTKTIKIKAHYSNGNITVFLPSGEMIGTSGVDKEIFQKVMECSTELEVRLLLFPDLTTNKSTATPVEEQEIKREKEEISKKISSIKHAQELIDSGLFIEKSGEIYMKEIEEIPLPVVMIDAFANVIDDEEKLAALTNFWYWLVQCPNPESRRDAYTFIERNDVSITPNGMLALYRSIVKVDKGDKRLAEFVSNAYAKVKLWKKSPKNYIVYKDKNDYVLYKSDVSSNLEKIGHLDELHTKIPEMGENHYTDNHTRTKTIKLGTVYYEDEQNIDTDNRVECSKGLHVGSRKFGINSFGDTRVLCLVNPMKIRAVPLYDSSKMRVQEMYIAAVMDDGDTYLDEEVDIVPLDDEYFSDSMENLRNKAKAYSVKEATSDKILVNELSTKQQRNVMKKLEEMNAVVKDRVKVI